MSRFRKSIWLLLILTAPSACTWVSLDQQGIAVQLVPASAVDGCKRVGTTTSTTRNKVGPIERGREKVATELLTLARNSAAAMGGNTLVEQGPMTDGKQTFVVYQCKR